MKMKLNSLPMLCLSLLLFHTHFSLAKRGGSFGKISFGKIFGSGSKKTSISSRGSVGATNTRPKSTNNQGSSSQVAYPRQPSGGVYHDQYSILGSKNRGNFGGYGGQGGYGGHGGGYMNYNPKNRILSPRFGGRFGYGGYGTRGGSPYSQAVQEMGMMPSDKSRKHGRKAMMAAAGGAMAGMALGYGLGRFPRPHFHFHSPQEEYYYNHYMYKKYGMKSTDTNDYSRDYAYSKPPESYDNYMDRCMKRTDLLPADNRQLNNKPAANLRTTAVTSGQDTGTGSNATKTNSTEPSAPHPLNIRVLPKPTVAAADDDDDTVSIVEIGYPALINQQKARRCLELYMVYSEKYLKRVKGGAQGLEMGSRGLLAVVTSVTLMLLNSNMLRLLH